MKPKPVMGVDDLLAYQWFLDKWVFANERQRVQLAAYHRYIGADIFWLLGVTRCSRGSDCLVGAIAFGPCRKRSS